MEAEEALREAAALGNLAAARTLIINGIDINARNRVNGWTPLHWACSRGNREMAELLIRHGARTDIANHKNQTPAELAKGDAASLFSQAYPDLTKLWSVPDTVPGSLRPLQPVPPMPASEVRPEAAAVAKEPAAQDSQAPVKVPDAAVTSAEHALTHVRVFLGDPDQRSVLGSIFIAPNATLADVRKQIHSELDGVPNEFGLSRFDGDLVVPIGRKQMGQSALMHLRAVARETMANGTPLPMCWLVVQPRQ
ncbi:hypothetical protein HK105_204269 [Polyrhizophydium stewartii]|uniref:Ankyrin repeat protein n=1 Tax=Polyrhizophydium stewartii TaxID=2732419 RepID=A0ABR4N9I1_9FUNG